MNLEIQENYLQINENIRNAAKRVARNPDDVKLVVVSKYKPVEIIQAAIDCGATIFGENYPEQALAKIDHFKKDAQVEWHMIGHLQSRKVKLIPGNFNLMHSVDSMKLAVKIDDHLRKINQKQRVLLEVNLSGEISKGGWDASDRKNWDTILSEFVQVIEMPGLVVEGLMTMPPLSDNPENSRVIFKKLCLFQEFMMKHTSEIYWKDLSMGTSYDYEVAVEEGARYVRIGQAILGIREKIR
ncbi:MAG: YggS family pyridoxal phosphate-dependent enzyme [Anaerolineaceae bacterium]|nr:YggS family pyridoxal phosphate-dependent enzyme [Anaerolineaceae bacterium]